MRALSRIRSAPDVVWNPDLGGDVGISVHGKGAGVRDMVQSWLLAFLEIGGLMKRLDTGARVAWLGRRAVGLDPGPGVAQSGILNHVGTDVNSRTHPGSGSEPPHAGFKRSFAPALGRGSAGEGSYVVELEEDYAVYDAVGQVRLLLQRPWASLETERAPPRAPGPQDVAWHAWESHTLPRPPRRRGKGCWRVVTWSGTSVRCCRSWPLCSQTRLSAKTSVAST